jgi:hypothetical protein
MTIAFQPLGKENYLPSILKRGVKSTSASAWRAIVQKSFVPVPGKMPLATSSNPGASSVKQAHPPLGERSVVRLESPLGAAASVQLDSFLGLSTGATPSMERTPSPLKLDDFRFSPIPFEENQEVVGTAAATVPASAGPSASSSSSSSSAAAAQPMRSEMAVNRVTQEIGFLDVIRYLDEVEDQGKAVALINKLHKAELNKFDQRGYTVAHYAVLNRAHSALQVLKTKGVDINAYSQGKSRCRPVDIALNEFYIARDEGNQELMGKWTRTFEFMKALRAKKGKLAFLPATYKPIIISSEKRASDQVRLESFLKNFKPLLDRPKSAIPSAMQRAASEIVIDPKTALREKLDLNIAAQVFKNK